MNIAILGFGREGRSLLSFLQNDARYKGTTFTILDRKPFRAPRGVAIKTGADYLRGLSKYDIVFRSPGIPYAIPEIQKAKKAGVVITSGTQLFFDECPATIIGVTGTKGKGTTTTLIYRILKAAERDVYLAGNIGIPMLDVLPTLTPRSTVVLELSSFQLEDLTRSPHIAVVLDVFPDHQDAHASMREYVAAKTAITKYQSPRDQAFYFPDNAKTKAIVLHGKGKKIAVRVPKSPRGHTLITPQDMRIPGYHNFKNAYMAATVTKALGIPSRTIVESVRAFTGNEHRLEFVAEKKGVRFFNDSASTTPDSSVAALKAFPNADIALIIGGKDKKLDYTPLTKALRGPLRKQLAALILIGENTPRILRAVRGISLPIVKAPMLESAVRLTYETLLMSSAKERVSILSPGAASFDMFANYAERGLRFKTAVRKLR